MIYNNPHLQRHPENKKKYLINLIYDYNYCAYD